MTKLVFLVEEPSISEVLEVLLPRLLPQNILFQVVPHEGKNDLEKSIPRKLKGWREPGVRFVVMRDNDNGDCKQLKARLMEMCAENQRADTLVRIVCQELEAWYLGDLAAVANAYNKPSLALQQNTRKFRDPDKLTRPSEHIQRLVPEFEKFAGARNIAPYLTIENARSHSFRAFVNGVRRLVVEATQNASNHQNTLDAAQSTKQTAPTD